MTPDALARSWAFDPGVLTALALTALLYARGARRVTASASRQATFWLGWLLVALALVSPIDVASSATLTAHMTQHLLLGLLAPLALASARPMAALRAGLPSPLRGGARWWAQRLHGLGARRHPARAAAIALVLHVGGFWFWHLPPLYDAALRHDLLHATEHVTLLAGGLALWAVVGRARWQDRTGVAVALLFASAVGSGALAAILTLANRPLYDAHLATTAPWHFTPLEDQQVAGALMWVPGGLVYALAAAIVFVRWLDAGPPRHAAGPVGRLTS